MFCRPARLARLPSAMRLFCKTSRCRLDGRLGGSRSMWLSVASSTRGLVTCATSAGSSCRAGAADMYATQPGLAPAYGGRPHSAQCRTLRLAPRRLITPVARQLATRSLFLCRTSFLSTAGLAQQLPMPPAAQDELLLQAAQGPGPRTDEGPPQRSRRWRQWTPAVACAYLRTPCQAQDVWQKLPGLRHALPAGRR